MRQKQIKSGYWLLTWTDPIWPATEHAIPEPILNVWYSVAEDHNPRLAVCETSKGFYLLDEIDHQHGMKYRLWPDLAGVKRYLRSLE